MIPPVYLDYQATTPIAPEALAAMRPWLEDGFGNPHSSHRMGRAAAAAVEAARAEVAALLPVGGRVWFTGSATEAANWALAGAIAPGAKIVLPDTEHAAVRDTASWLGTQGHPVVLLPVDRAGLVDPDMVAAAIATGTAGCGPALVAAMLVNNEIGVIQPVAQIAAVARAAGALMFCDAVQGYGRVDIPIAPDLIAISAHKIHGPKGIGALWVRDGVPLRPLLHGGGQEGGLRSGTLSPALCAGFGAAARLMAERRAADAAQVAMLWDRARTGFTGWTVNGSETERYRGNLNIRRDGIDVARLISEVRGVAFSAGSACASGSGRPSHVLKAIGLDDVAARSSIRLGFGRYTTAEELDRAIGLILAAAERQGVKAA